MSYCLNPSCQKTTINPPGTIFCVSCGTKLLLKERYRTIQPIGEGSFGRTFLAEDAHRLNASCVIKQFLPLSQIQGNSAAMEKATQLFEQEARRLLDLGEQHSQIPTLYAYFEQDKRLYLVQQYIKGQNLWQELEHFGALSEQQIWELLEDLLPLLQFVHEAQVIHRDIKPTNIVRRQRDRKLVLIDFGVSKQLTVGTGLTKTGTKAGTEGYAPIEQLRSGKAYPASDLYSLGVTCIHLLTAAELDELYDPLEGNWVWQEYLRKKGKDVSSKLSQVLDKLLKDYVKERYQSAAEVLKDLNSAPILPLPILQTSLPAPQIPLPLGVVQASPQKLNPVPFPSKTQKWRCIRTLTGHLDWVRCVAISPDGQTLVSGSGDNTIKIWQLASGQVFHTLTKHSNWVFSVAISPNGQTLVSGSGDNTIKIWQLANGQLIHTLTGHSDLVHSVAISPNGQIIASGSDDKTIKIWQLGSGNLIRRLMGHSDCVFSVAISPDGQTLVSGSGDNTIKIWHQATGQLIRTLARHSDLVRSVAISPDGQTLVSGSADNTINIWQLSTGQLIRTFMGHSSHVHCVAVSMDGQTVVSGSGDNTIKIWQLATGKLLCNLTGHSGVVFSVAISQDGQTLISGSRDNTIKIWRCD